jgi:hypothetical protein
VRPVRCAAAAAVLASSLGCGSTTLDHHVERLLTIRQGIYGQVSVINDVCPDGVCPEAPVANELSVFGSALPSPVPVRSSATLGFYELALPQGSFEICYRYPSSPPDPSPPDACSAFAVVEEQRVRRDLRFGLGGGWWL